jgi:adenine-specific DNA-methyltransferase
MKTALANFQTLPLKDAARQLLAELGYQSDKFLVGAGSRPQEFLADFASGHAFDQTKALVPEWKSADLLFQLTDQELSRETSLFTDTSVKAGLLKSYVFIAIELKGSDYARGRFSAIARQINRLFPMPVMVIFKHGDCLTIAVINRRRNKLDESKDVLEKATLIRDITFAQPHRGHLDILASLALPNLVHPQKKPITDFDTLHAAWEQIFNVELLNERFYKELSNWYFWALPQVEFPADLEADDEKRRATGLIRLLTRLIFCWFLKEKGLIPEKLFHPTDLAKILKGFDPESETSSTYYQAILQNLFFATLNQRMGKDSNGKPYRLFAKDEGFAKNRATYDVNNLYRYEALFRDDPEAALSHFADIPFLNGGLFECLDRTEDGTDKKRYLDGFSRNAKKRPHVPDRLFFDSGETADLSEAYGDKKRKAEKVTGLISILSHYKFTIVENTPIDQEIALDPELLGKVFENLLASYNEETKTTARKQSGSFYTPRPIVDYMVDESLKAHLTRALVDAARMKEPDARAGLDLLFAYTEKEHAFTPAEVATLIAAIDTLKILDPACGSGAFPMGVLHKLVYILGKLDHDNDRWKQTQLAKLDSAPMREELERAFADNNDDYGRKLYLIENCLYGVDIQPIAIQITKLRFFISLVCDQKTNRNKKDNHGIRPLPNLETKFVAANSLIGLPEMTQSLLVDPRVGVIEKEIEFLYHSHFSIQRRDQKLALQRKIKSLRQELAKLLAESLMSPAKAKHIAEWDPFDPQSCADFFDPHWMFGRALVAGFDVVIGNPPYFKENDDKHRFDGLRDLPCYQGKMDVWYLFVDVGLGFLRANGVLSFIATNNWVTNAGASKVRNKILKEAILVSLIDFQDYMIFESASIQTMVMLLVKAGAPARYRATISKAKSSFVREDVSNLQSGIHTESENLKTFTVEINREELLDKPLLFNSEDKSSILDTIDATGGIRLLNSEIAQGIVPNPDRVNSRNIKILGERVAQQRGVQAGDGVFVLDKAEKAAIKAAEFKYLKPLYEPTHIEKYSRRPTDLQIIYAKKGYFDPEDAPSIVAHLRRFKEIMEARRENQTGQIQFYNLHWPRDESFFKQGEKLLVPRKCSEPIFYHTEDPAYVMLSMNVIRTMRMNMRFLSGVLNSSVVRYWLRYRGNMQGLNFQIDAAPLLRIPIPKEPASKQSMFGAIVALIQFGHQEGESSSIAAADFLEDLIDACVMESYFREHMAERDLLFHDTVAPHLAAYAPEASAAQQRDFLTHLHQTLNAPSHPIRNRLLRLTADSPDLLAVIKAEGRV